MPKKNPLNLNPLQLRTLTLLQELARHPELSTRLDSGEVLITGVPTPHGNHFHIGPRVVASRDATGLANPAVGAALARKGLIDGDFPTAFTLTEAGLAYDTGLREAILHGSDH